jgi:acetolactate synthase I/II/III large subunit
MNRTPTVASVIAGDLVAYGARCCFGLLGTANFKISHALVEAGVELISARHECNAASMGDAYAKATGELTLVSVHSGPGLTNALTGIGEAAKPGVFVIDGKINPNLEADWHAEHFPS